jgi:hypothetical protein
MDLRWRKNRCSIAPHLVKQVVEACVRKLSLRRSGPSSQGPATLGSRPLDACLEKRGLSDPGLALNDNGARPSRKKLLEDLYNGSKLTLSSEDLRYGFSP